MFRHVLLDKYALYRVFCQCRLTISPGNLREYPNKPKALSTLATIVAELGDVAVFGDSRRL